MTTTPVRLWHQSMTEIDGLDGYRRRLESHAAALFGDAVHVDVHGLAAGSYGGVAPTEVLGSPDVHRRVSMQSLAAARTAAAEGYDAFVIGSFSEPMLAETRAAVGIPVVSLNESTALVACSLGTRTAFIANAPAIAALVADSLERHGLTARSAGAVALDPGLTEPELLADDPRGVVERFVTASRTLIADGADVLVPAEGVMGEVLWEAGLHDVGGVPVLDSVGVTWRYALLLVELARDGTASAP